jgi:hypothetical protein
VLLLEPWAEANAIDVIPGELEQRDIFVQVSYLWLRGNLTPDTYALTAGAYVDTVTILENHLDVLDPSTNFQPHGDRLLLGHIIVAAAPDKQEPVPDSLTPSAAELLKRLRSLNDAWFKQ